MHFLLNYLKRLVVWYKENYIIILLSTLSVERVQKFIEYGQFVFAKNRIFAYFVFLLENHARDKEINVKNCVMPQLTLPESANKFFFLDSPFVCV